MCKCAHQTSAFYSQEVYFSDAQSVTSRAPCPHPFAPTDLPNEPPTVLRAGCRFRSDDARACGHTALVPPHGRELSVASGLFLGGLRDGSRLSPSAFWQSRLFALHFCVARNIGGRFWALHFHERECGDRCQASRAHPATVARRHPPPPAHPHCLRGKSVRVVAGLPATFDAQRRLQNRGPGIARLRRAQAHHAPK